MPETTTASRSWRAAAYQIGSAVSGVEPNPVWVSRTDASRDGDVVADDAVAIPPGAGEQGRVPGRGLGGQRADRTPRRRPPRAQRGQTRHQPARHRVVDHLRPRAVQAQQHRPRLPADVGQAEPRVEGRASCLLPRRKPQRPRGGGRCVQARTHPRSTPARTASSNRRRRSGRPPGSPRSRGGRPPPDPKPVPRWSAGRTRGGRPASSRRGCAPGWPPPGAPPARSGGGSGPRARSPSASAAPSGR